MNKKRQHIISTQNDYDIAIIGAGPGGTTTALTLRNSGLRVVLIDKGTFPRDKICGDAIPGPAFKVMRSLGGKYETRLFDLKERSDIKASTIVAPNGKALTVKWISKSYNSPRLDFDNFLLEIVKNETNVEIVENFKVKKIEKIGDVFSIQNGKKTITAKFIIGCDGANSIVAKRLNHFTLDRQHHCGAVRAYFTNVTAIQPTVNEFFLLKKFLPGYFWLFPVGNNRVNVGFGMLSKHISKQNINLKTTLKEIINQNELLKERFKNAKIEGKITGFGLPLGSRKAKLCGDGFLLVGDAGSLIDPLQGHGIDKAMLSGKLAGEQAIRCFKANRFDKKFLEQYEREVYQKVGGDLTRNYWLMRFLTNKPWLISLGVSLASNAFIRRLLLKIAYLR